MDPDVLILDEPTAGLDPQGRDKLLNQILSYHKERKNTVILVSHSMEDIARVADRILVMNKGNAEILAPKREVFAQGERLEKMGLRVPFGQYIPGKSIVHKLDPRTKLILLVCYIVLIFCTFNFYALGVTIALAIAFMLLSRVPVKQYLKSMKMMIVIIIITSVFNLFYGGGKTYLTIGPLSITEGGINNSIFIVTRIVCLLIASASLTFTTSPTDLTAGIEMLMKPLKVLHVKTHEIAMMMSIALRFVPTLLEETDKIMLAQKSRGANMDEGNIIKRAKALIPIFIPLFVSAFRRAFDLAMAMECRCYNGGNGRTKLNTLKLSKRDYFSYITFLLLIGVIVVCNIFLGSVVR